MELHDINTYLQKCKREFVQHSLQNNLNDFTNFCNQNQKTIILPRKHDFYYFTDYVVKVRNRSTNAYELVDWSLIKEDKYLETYNFLDTIQETTIQKVCDYLLVQLGYIITEILAPIQEVSNTSLTSAQTFQKSCASIKSILNHSGLNLEYTTVKNFINYIIQKLLQNNTDLIGKLPVGEVLKMKGFDKLYIGWN